MSSKIVLGVSGGIAAYKAPGLVRELARAGYEVRVVVTRGALEFTTPLALQVVSGAPVGRELFDASYESEIGHIELARWADAVLIAPATAHFIAKMAHGLADDLLTTVLLATEAPVVVAPAMNTKMWEHARVQRNVSALADDGVAIVAPDSGDLACREVGAGRLPDPPALLGAIARALGPNDLAGRDVLVTAGPTREAIDAARFISNPSTGKMGYAMATEAHRRGAERVTLISGPVSLDAPYGVELVGVTTALEMHEAVFARAHKTDVIIKSAAVADVRPAGADSTQKRAKASLGDALDLAKNPDILAELGARWGPGAGETGPVLVGFAAATEGVEVAGRDKLARKRAHWMVANRIGGERGGFGSEENEVFLIDHRAPARTTHLGSAPKPAIAREVWDRIAASL